MSLHSSDTPVLNWREIAQLTEAYREKVEGLFLDRIIVPDRTHFPSGYLKGEWALRLTGRKRECCLLISVRTRHPYIALLEGKGPKAATQATHSAFDLTLSKQLKGAKLLQLQALPRERTVILWFTHSDLATTAHSKSRLGLVLNLIPAAPEALLVSADSETSSKAPHQGWPIVSRSRAKFTPSDVYLPPDGSQAPDNLPFRHELVQNADKPDTFYHAIEKTLENEAFELRLRTVEKKLKELLKTSAERIHQSETAIREAERESNWQYFADALKHSLGNFPECIPDDEAKPNQTKPNQAKSKWVRIVPDYLTGETLRVPCNPQLSPTEQVEAYYQLARRKTRRIDEARARYESFRENGERFEAVLSELSKLAIQRLRTPDGLTGPALAGPALAWPALERIERAAQIAPSGRPKSDRGTKGIKGSQWGDHWLGKNFISKDGGSIWVGRNKTENLELTFKRARGNDVWMHVRGRPSAHILIPVQPGKSVSLDTLLDAANLCIYYSGGENWGKTEIDYTFKKHVKRIKDSSEASYTHNKTLLVEPDSARLKRLLSGDDWIKKS